MYGRHQFLAFKIGYGEFSPEFLYGLSQVVNARQQDPVGLVGDIQLLL